MMLEVAHLQEDGRLCVGVSISGNRGGTGDRLTVFVPRKWALDNNLAARANLTIDRRGHAVLTFTPQGRTAFQIVNKKGSPCVVQSLRLMPWIARTKGLYRLPDATTSRTDEGDVVVEFTLPPQMLSSSSVTAFKPQFELVPQTTRAPRAKQEPPIPSADAARIRLRRAATEFRAACQDCRDAGVPIEVTLDGDRLVISVLEEL